VAVTYEVSAMTSGTEAVRVLAELYRLLADAHGVTPERQDENTLRIRFFGTDDPEARRLIEDRLAGINPSWPIHVRLERL
jgi:hypothetical protein